MNQLPDVSIVLPVYNQADHIGNIIEAYLSVLDNFRYNFELILVVNSNNDDSLQVCKSIAETHSSVQILYNEKSGWGLAVRTGLEAARGKTVCFTNSARTSPYTLVSLVAFAIANPDYVIKANRKLRYPLIRRIGSGLYNLQCRALFDFAVWDLNGTPKVFRRDLIGELNLEEDEDLVDLEFIVKCEKLGLQIIEIPIVSSDRHSGKTTTNFRSALKMYWGAFSLWWGMREKVGEGTGAGNS